MLTTLRRVFWLALIGGIGYGGWMIWQNRSADEPAAAPEWPPLPPPTTPPVSTAPAPTPDAAWVDPVDGTCPTGFPIKAKHSTDIFHVPGGRFYDRTVPERCYADAEAAEADGYRRAKA